MAATEKGTILCVDDDRDVLDSIAAILESEGYKTVCAGNGIDGLELFEQHKKELWGVLTDARMPKMDGLELARRIRESGSGMPIMLVTAYMTKGIFGRKRGESVTVEDYHDAGINAHIEKPFNQDDLLRAVEITFDAYGRKHSPPKNPS